MLEDVAVGVDEVGSVGLNVGPSAGKLPSEEVAPLGQGCCDHFPESVGICFFQRQKKARALAQLEGGCQESLPLPDHVSHNSKKRSGLGNFSYRRCTYRCE